MLAHPRSVEGSIGRILCAWLTCRVPCVVLGCIHCAPQERKTEKGGGHDERHHTSREGSRPGMDTSERLCFFAPPERI